MAHRKTQTEWETEMSEKILEHTRNEIYLELRFLEIALSQLVPKADGTVQTFATDGAYLCFSSEQVLRVFRQNAFFLNRVYLHTVLHCLFSHLWIGGAIRRGLWQLACDIAVEYVIDGMDKQCTRRILSFTRKELYAKLQAKEGAVSAAVIYRMLKEMETQEDGMEQLLLLEREFYTDDHKKHLPRQREGGAASRRQRKIKRNGRRSQDRRVWSSSAGETRQKRERSFFPRSLPQSAADAAIVTFCGGLRGVKGRSFTAIPMSLI